MTVRSLNVLLLLLCFLFSVDTFAVTHDESNAQINFLALTDIHFDPFVACYEVSQKPCPLITKLRAASAEEWSSLFAASDKSVPEYRQDTNYSLLISSLATAKNAVETQHVQFVLVLGDFLGHDFRRYYKKYAQDKTYAGYQAFVKKTFVFLTSEIAHAFPSTDVYLLLGNNDSYRHDYYSDPRSQFFQDMAQLGSGLIKNKTNRAIMQHDFALGGYYAVDVPTQKNIRLVMLNSVLFSSKAKGKNIQQFANQELEWLHQELIKAKEKNQRVLIAMHIPEGIDVYVLRRIRLFRLIHLWEPNFIEKFQTELQQFSSQILGLLAGHLHMDWFQVLQFKNLDKIPLVSVPSISPIFGNNPKFKIYSYSLETHQLHDFITYYYPIDGSTGQWFNTSGQDETGER